MGFLHVLCDRTASGHFVVGNFHQRARDRQLRYSRAGHLAVLTAIKTSEEAFFKRIRAGGARNCCTCGIGRRLMPPASRHDAPPRDVADEMRKKSVYEHVCHGPRDHRTGSLAKGVTLHKGLGRRRDVGCYCCSCCVSLAQAEERCAFSHKDNKKKTSSKAAVNSSSEKLFGTKCPPKNAA